MDPLSITASAIAVLQLTGAVIQVCYSYKKAVKEASSDMRAITAELEGLQTVLNRLVELAKSQDTATPPSSLLVTLGQLSVPLSNCEAELESLKTKLTKAVDRKAFGKALVWPLRKQETEKVLQVFERSKATFDLALGADQMALGLVINDGVNVLKDDVTIVREGVDVLRVDITSVQQDITIITRDVSSTRSDISRVEDGVGRLHDGVTTLLSSAEQKKKDDHKQKVYEWLAGTIPSLKHNETVEKRQVDTGEWLIRGEEFQTWKTDSHSFLWLHGIPGCGKTVLCSKVIDELMAFCKGNDSSAVLYFYFDFSDRDTRGHEKLVRSLIYQLSIQGVEIPAPLVRLYDDHLEGKNQPSLKALMTTLKELLLFFENTYIIIDAIDEFLVRHALLPLIKQISDWRIDGVHMLITSRRERDIELTFSPIVTTEVCATGARVDGDIRNHIQIVLQNDPVLSPWPASSKDEIERILMEGAHGMFQWVWCQLNTLRRSVRPGNVKKTLASLPKTLDETYERILASIDDSELGDDALRVLQWLAFSVRPLKMEEIAEALAVDLDDGPQYSVAMRLGSPQDIFNICSSLVSFSTAIIQDSPSVSAFIKDRPYQKQTEEKVIKLSHFSIKEYLLSGRIQKGKGAISRFSISEYDSNIQIISTCLGYLLQFDQNQYTAWKSGDRDFPLGRYASKHWVTHARSLGADIPDTLAKLILDFLQQEKPHYIAWLRFYQADIPYRDNLESEVITPALPLYYMSFGGLKEMAERLIKQGADVNAKGGHYGNALQAAAFNGHEDIIQLLLSNEADPCGWGGVHGTALHAAALNGHETVVRMLIAKGADVNAEGLGPAKASKLPPAMFQWLVQLTNINIPEGGGYHPSVLEVAATNGHQSVVQLLLDNKAKVTAGTGYFGSALHAAAFFGWKDIVRQLLDTGVDPNMEAGHFGTALSAARGNADIVQLLREHKAPVQH